MKPNEFIARLQSIAQDSRHHPEPAVAVAVLAQLLLDLTLELQPLANKYAMVLNATGFLDNLDKAILQTQADMQNTAAGSPAEPVALDAGTVEALAALVDPALAGAPEFAAEVLPATPAA